MASAAEMKFTIKHWLVAVALFAVAHRIFLSPFFWLSLYPWAWLCHADWVFTVTSRQFDAAIPGSLFCLVAGLLVQAAIIGPALAYLTKRKQASPLGDAPPPITGAQQNQISK
jgi:hypothetical protein